ncbi:MAG TPA: hypothetical protein ENI68_08340 [Gammaproteobacteria bacterium]|nr:hypothetical protein [Gammaproteobacteria bacterium]
MPALKTTHPKPCTYAWLLLLFLSTASYLLGQDKTGTLFITSVLCITVIKGHLIIRYFMGIRGVKPLWHIIMGTYLAIIGAIIGIAYLSQ